MILKKLKTISIVGIVLALSGCSSTSEHVEIMPRDSEQVGQSPSPVFFVGSMKPKDQEVLRMAYFAMMQVLDSDEYTQKMNQKMLRAGCLSDVKVSGQTVIEDLKLNTIPVDLKKKNSRNAKATTDIVERWMRINESRFDNWDLGIAEQAEMVNTLIHETTHLVPYDKKTPPNKNWYYKYYDQGHNTNNCNDEDLVSYVAGNTAEQVWLTIGAR